jgi:hypothetical protein
MREGGEEGDMGSAMLLTTTRSSGGTSSMAKTSGAALCRAAEVRRWRACAARVSEARTAAVG